MFDSLFDNKVLLASKVDSYLDRVGKILDIKEKAMKVNESVLEDDMNEFIHKTLKIANLELEKVVKEYTEKEKTDEQ